MSSILRWVLLIIAALGGLAYFLGYLERKRHSKPTIDVIPLGCLYGACEGIENCIYIEARLQVEHMDGGRTQIKKINWNDFTCHSVRDVDAPDAGGKIIFENGNAMTLLAIFYVPNYMVQVDQAKRLRGRLSVIGTGNCSFQTECTAYPGAPRRPS